MELFKSDMARAAQTYTVQSAGLHLHVDHLSLAGSQQCRHSLLQRTCRIHYANLIGVRLVRGEECGEPEHVVLLRLVHYAGRRRHVELLRFDQNAAYADNLRTAQPWLDALVARIKPQLARELCSLCINNRRSSPDGVDVVTVGQSCRARADHATYTVALPPPRAAVA